MTDRLFNRQFLITDKNGFDLPWPPVKVASYTLFVSPNIDFTHTSENGKELFLIGYLYDYQEPYRTNKQILESLSQTNSFDEFIVNLNKYAGHFAIIYKSQVDFKIVNDACGQAEVYFDTSFSAIGSQPKIIEKVTEHQSHSNKEANDFYSSPTFLSKKVFVGDTTHRSNIRHLQPNHLIDLNQKKVVRFFPIHPLEEISVKESAKKAVTALKGYIKAAAIRDELAMAVTGGYDSRVLFLASLDVDCKYFVSKHKYMPSDHYDITIPQKLTSLHNKEFEVIPDREDAAKTIDPIREKSIDFPRNQIEPSRSFEGRVYLNGNISEIARNYYGYFSKISPSDLSYLNGYADSPFAEQTYNDWLSKNESTFISLGYNILDMFYWEEKMGNWSAKAKTEASIDRVIFSPFCSRELLVTLLSTNRKYRDSHYNKLYDLMIGIMSPEVLKIPINPCLKQRTLKLMKIFRVYNLYRRLGLKYRFLKI